MHYVVISGMMEESSQREPPEQYMEWVEIDTDTEKSALALALRTKELANWVNYCRRHGESPFGGGIRVEDAYCPHGVCWVCEPDTCKPCLEEMSFALTNEE